MGETMKFITDKLAVCSDCNQETSDKDCEAWARKHAIETGHDVTLIVTYQISPATTRGESNI